MRESISESVIPGFDGPVLPARGLRVKQLVCTMAASVMATGLCRSGGGSR